MTTSGWSPDPAGVFFSDRFNVDPRLLADYGAMDICVVTDLPLFIDPFLLFNSENPQYRALHDEMITYLRFLKEKSSGGISPGLVQSLYRFGEVRQNWLGFSTSGNSGHGLGRKFAIDLNATFSTLLSNLGSETATQATHVEKVSLVRSGVGRDTISDFTTNLIKHYLCKWTEAFAVKHVDSDLRRKFAVPRAAFNYVTETWMTLSYELPALDGDFVLLSPIDLLTRDDTFINRTDMINRYEQIATAVPDSQLRAQVNNYFSKQLSSRPTSKEIRRARIQTMAEFPDLVDQYIKSKEDAKESASADSLGKVLQLKQVLNRAQSAASDIQTRTSIFSGPSPWTSLEEARAAISAFKQYVEHQDGYKLINGPRRALSSEKDVQIFFGAILARSRYDVNREPNNGRGPVDYKVSSGSDDKCLIEFKLASSTSLKRNLQKQVEIYEAANVTRNSVTAIVCYTASDTRRVLNVLRQLGLEQGPDLVVIDARSDNKPSASKA